MVDESIANLAQGIILFAIEDWRHLIKSKAYRGNSRQDKSRDYSKGSFSGLRSFFRSEWCDLLLTVCNADATGDYILNMLEGELDEAVAKDRTKMPSTKGAKYMCLEDGFTCNSLKEAGKHCGVSWNRVRQVVDQANLSANGKHWISYQKE